MKKYYPIMLDIEGKPCAVIGGGKVAERKVRSLLDCGAKVTVVSPQLTAGIKKLADENLVRVLEREYRWGDLKDHDLVYVATDDPEVNALCLREARQEEILINVVDKPDMCDFIVPAAIQRGDLTITVSTNGKSPMLSRKIREELEKMYGEEYAVFLEVMGDLRKMILSEWKDIRHRRAVFEKIVYGDVFDRYKNGEIQDLKKFIIDHFLQVPNGNDR
ncbi:precorrin-2 dehydrogenase/sirohydrochlorin ferrochelatase family protein [Thermotalea metallivorans]|uniref:precorrin-2 dehydrogenase n=1 Tax=Thermotalea metallivorans TaxID=520762 RepID=A0A140LEC9_9FIRM|nr:bifunctional precorrin-2 dehydrogenase/sirohydrochlorin ferrochelatase [Thermotalea metallivorans]KXG78904.1 Siroheme synthase [Thermotalea metallivorans]